MKLLLDENEFLNLLNLATLAADANFSTLRIHQSDERISSKALNKKQIRCVTSLEEWIVEKKKPLTLTKADAIESPTASRRKKKSISPFGFYAGFPLLRDDNTIFGVLSICGRSPASLTRNQVLILKGIARQITHILARIGNFQKSHEARSSLLEPEDIPEIRSEHAQQLATEGRWEFNPSSEKFLWSSEACRILGIDRKAFACSLEEFIPYIQPEDRGTFILANEHFIHHGTPYAIKLNILCFDGKIISVLNRAELAYEDHNKRLIGTISKQNGSPVSIDSCVTPKRGGTLPLDLYNEKNYFRALFKASPEPYLVLTPDDFRIVAVNQAYLDATRTRHEDIIGRKIFDIFPDDPNDARATGVKNLRASLDRVKQNGEADIMAIQRYPIRIPDAAGETFVERYWMPINSPVINEDRIVTSIIHRVEDVTEYIRSKKRGSVDTADAPASREDMRTKEADIVLRSFELKQLAQKATENERRFRSAFTNSLVGMSIATLDGKFVDCNDRLAEMIGYSKEELFRISVKDITHPDDWPANEKILAELIQGKRKAFEIRKRYLHRNGKIIVGLNYVSAIFDGDAKPYHLYGVTIDITQEQLAKQQLLQHEELLRLGERMAHIGSWSYDLEEEKKWHWSDELYRMHGISPAVPLTFSLISNSFTPAWQPVFNAAIEACLLDGTLYDLEAQIENAQGKTLWVRIIGEAKRNDRGQIIGAHGAYLDISKAKNNEVVLREQAALLDAATDAIIVRSLDDRILYWNRAAEKQYGWRADEVLGRPVKDVLYSESEVPFEEALERVKKDGDYSGQLTHLRKDGSKVIVQSHWTLVRHDDGAPKSILAIHTDISERMELEQKMMQMQKLNALGQLTGGIAHDFNNLLTVINGSAEVLSEEPENAMLIQQLARTIHSAGARGAQLTNRLLAFARRQDLEPGVVDLPTAVNNMVKMLQPTLGEQMHLSTRFASDVWPAFLDEAQFESALLNLCINARDAMPNGGEVKIAVDNASVDKRYIEMNPDARLGDYVIVSVEDTGTGMTPEILSRAFEPFFTTKGIGEGNGLGLSMVYGFIAQSNGHIKIASDPGHGTIVKMYFPKAPAGAMCQPDHRTSSQIIGGSESILMVEDNELVKAHGKRLLEELGYHVQTASDAHEAMAMLQRGDKYDLLFTDILIPNGINGFGLAKKALAINPCIQVLFTSGYSDASDRNSENIELKYPILRKPYQRHVLAEKIREALQFFC